MLKKLWRGFKEAVVSMFVAPPEPERMVYRRETENKGSYTGPEYWARVSEEIQMEQRRNTRAKSYDATAEEDVLEETESDFTERVKEWKQNNAMVNDYFNRRYSVA